MEFPSLQSFRLPRITEPKTHSCAEKPVKRKIRGEPRSRLVQNHASSTCSSLGCFRLLQGRPGGDAGRKDSNLRGRRALLSREPAWELTAETAWPAPTGQEENYKLWGKPQAQPGRRETSQCPAPSGRPCSRAFFPGRRRPVTSRLGLARRRHGHFFFSFFTPPSSVRHLVPFNAHLHRRNIPFQMAPCVPPESTHTRSFIYTRS